MEGIKQTKKRKLSVSRTGKTIFIEKEDFLCPHGFHMTRAKEWIDQSIVLMITIIKIRYSSARTMLVIKLRIFIIVEIK